jgi:hypothetical protein
MKTPPIRLPMRMAKTAAIAERAKRARHDGQYHDVRAEPYREQVGRPSVALAGRYRIDGVLFY